MATIQVGRKHLITSKRIRLVIKVAAMQRNVPVSALVHRLIDIGLRYEDEARRRKINAPLFQRPPNIKYVVARSEKTYLSVSDGVYLKVKEYAREEGLKLIEASWRLFAIGFQYDFGGDPRSNPAFSVLKDQFQMITDNVRKRKGNIADEYLVDPETWAIEKVDEIMNPRHQRIVRQQAGSNSSEINKLNRQKRLREELLVDMSKVIEALKAENTILKQKLKIQASIKPRERNNLEKENDLPALD
jgi:hypothetical protein